MLRFCYGPNVSHKGGKNGCEEDSEWQKKMTYNELQKMPLTKLKDYALGLGGIHGVHGMKKQQLIQAICEVAGIVDTSKEAAAKRKALAQKEIKKLKVEARTLRTERDKKRAELSRKELDAYRRKIKKLKRKTRQLAKQ